jgi:hypothetical protein
MKTFRLEKESTTTFRLVVEAAGRTWTVMCGIADGDDLEQRVVAYCECCMVWTSLSRAASARVGRGMNHEGLLRLSDWKSVAFYDEEGTLLHVCAGCEQADSCGTDFGRSIPTDERQAELILVWCVPRLQAPENTRIQRGRTVSNKASEQNSR